MEIKYFVYVEVLNWPWCKSGNFIEISRTIIRLHTQTHVISMFPLTLYGIFKRKWSVEITSNQRSIEVASLYRWIAMCQLFHLQWRTKMDDQQQIRCHRRIYSPNWQRLLHTHCYHVHLLQCRSFDIRWILVNDWQHQRHVPIAVAMLVMWRFVGCQAVKGVIDLKGIICDKVDIYTDKFNSNVKRNLTCRSASFNRTLFSNRNFGNETLTSDNSMVMRARANAELSTRVANAFNPSFFTGNTTYIENFKPYTKYHKQMKITTTKFFQTMKFAGKKYLCKRHFRRTLYGIRRICASKSSAYV